MKEKNNVKQVLVIRRDLNMRRGKQIAQGSHASMAVLLDLMKKECLTCTIEDSEATIVKFLGEKRTLKIVKDTPLDVWLNGMFTKICVSCENEDELLKLHEIAKEKNIPTSLITDAGLTEFKGVPTNTCIAIGPYWSEEINEITGNLKLM